MLRPRAVTAAAWAGCTKTVSSNVRVTCHVTRERARKTKPSNGVGSSSHAVRVFRSRYLGSTKFTVTGIQTLIGTPSLVPGR